MPYPFASAQRVYILKSIPAQSHDSVPPAPAFMLRMALFLSVSSPSRLLNSSSSSLRCSLWISASKCLRDSLSSGPAMVRISSISLRSASNFANGSTTDLSSFSSLIMPLERFSSFQKSGLESSVSRAFTLSDFLATSKITSEFFKLLPGYLQFLPQFFYHGFLKVNNTRL